MLGGFLTRSVSTRAAGQDLSTDWHRWWNGTSRRPSDRLSQSAMQRCWVHKTRNVLDKVKRKDQPAVKKALSRISHATNHREATEAYWRFTTRWRKIYPRAVACVEKDLEQLLSFFQINNSQLWSRLRTTNLIERAFVEVRRRTRPMGVMAHTQSIQRIVFAVFHHLNNNWSQHPRKKFTRKS